MMHPLLILSAIMAIAHSAEDETVHDEWKAFKAKYGRKYKSAAEEKEKYKIFAANKKYIDGHNKMFANGEASFQLAMNEFGDMLPEEFVKTMNGYRANGTESGGSTYMPPANFNDSSLPLMVDWRAKGAVTPVKSQGPQCSSCWAFSTTGSLEGQNFLKTGYLVSLSEQNLVDCSGPFGNGGCRGGKMTNAFKYIQANGGIDTEQSYPYMGMDQYCSFRREYVGATCTGHKVIARGSEDFLKMAVATVGPISAAIDASHPSFQFYHGGVYYEQMCSSQILDHAVLVVGYGVQAGRKYWLVKNSYGPSWGLNGYFLMSRDLNNHCGIATDASFPLV